MRTCANCGTSVSDDKDFCTFCGNPMYMTTRAPKTVDIVPGDDDDTNPADLAADNEKTERPDDDAAQVITLQEEIPQPAPTPRSGHTHPNQKLPPKHGQPRAQRYPNPNVPQRPMPNQTNPTHNNLNPGGYYNPYNNYRPQQPSGPRTVDRQPQPSATAKGNKTLTIVLIVCVTLLVLLIGVGIYIYSDSKQGAPQEQEYGNEARSMDELAITPGSNAFVVSGLNLRTEPSTASAWSVKATLPFGTEVYVQKIDGDWGYVRVIGPTYKGLEGWLAIHYVVSPRDFTLLQSFLANEATQKALRESYYLYALMQYFNDRNYIGRVSDSALASIGMTDFQRTDNNQWEIRVTSQPPYPSEMLKQKLINPYSKYDDLAVIITNICTGERRLLYFIFDDNEQATLYRDIPIGALGKITSISKKPSGDLEVYLGE